MILNTLQSHCWSLPETGRFNILVAGTSTNASSQHRFFDVPELVRGYNVWPSDTSTIIVATLGRFGFFSGFSQVLSAYIDGPSILLTSATWSIKDHATPTSRCCELSPEPLGLTWKVAHERVKWSLPRNHVDTLNEYIILYYIMYIMYLLSWAVWGSKDLQLQLQASPRIL